MKKIGVFVLLFFLVINIYLPVSKALWVNHIEMNVNDNNEIVLNLKIYDQDRDFGINYGGENKLLFIREKSEISSYSFLKVECTPAETFVVRNDWIMFNNTIENVKYRGYTVSIEDDLREFEIELSIKLSWNRGAFSPFESNSLGYPFDRYNGDLLLVFFTEDQNETCMLANHKVETYGSNFELNNMNFYYNGTYPVLNLNYFVIIHETNDMQIKRTFFEISSIGISLWILVFLLIAISYMVWNCRESGKVIRLYMGFFVPTLFVFGFLQNAGSLATMPLIIFGSILMISTFLLCINVLMEIQEKDKLAKQKREFRKTCIQTLLGLWLIGTFFLIILTRNSFLYLYEWFFGNSFLIFTTLLSLFLISCFILLYLKRKQSKTLLLNHIKLWIKKIKDKLKKKIK